MELLLKAALTATVVTALILAANRFGERLGGWLSALPFTAVPALLSVGHDRGLLAAENAAVGGVLGCALAALFAASYHAAARRLSPLATVAIAVAMLVAGLAVLGRVQVPLPAAVAMACGCSAAAMLFIRHDAAQCTATATRSLGLQLAVAAGLTSAAVTTLAVVIDASLAGIIAAMPTIGIATVASCHSTRGRGAVPRCLRAYVAGSFAKAIFCATFALCVCTHGMAIALLVAGLLGALGCAGTFLAGRLAGKGATGKNLDPYARPQAATKHPLAPADRSAACAQARSRTSLAAAGVARAQCHAYSLDDLCGADEAKMVCSF